MAKEIDLIEEILSELEDICEKVGKKERRKLNIMTGFIAESIEDINKEKAPYCQEVSAVLGMIPPFVVKLLKKGHDFEGASLIATSMLIDSVYSAEHDGVIDAEEREAVKRAILQMYGAMMVLHSKVEDKF